MDGSLTPPPNQTDGTSVGDVDQWLRLARDGSRAALGRALDAARERLMLIAGRALDDKLKSKIGASDLVQDTFADAQRGFGQFRGKTKEEFNAWLLAILTNRLANNIRRYRLTESRNVDREVLGKSVEAAMGSLQDDSATPGAAAMAREERRRVQVALDRMPESLRSVLVERTWQGASFVEIGARRGISADAARKFWARAVRRLHKVLFEIE